MRMSDLRLRKSNTGHRLSDIDPRLSDFGPGTLFLIPDPRSQILAPTSQVPQFHPFTDSPIHRLTGITGKINRLAQRRYRERERAAERGPRGILPQAPHHSVGVR